MNDVELTRAMEACETICRLLPRNSPSRVEMEKRRQGMIDELSKRRHAAMRNDAQFCTSARNAYHASQLATDPEGPRFRTVSREGKLTANPPHA